MEPVDGSWALTKEMAADALELPARERPAFLERVCTDPRLRSEVERLIGACESAEKSGAFLESPASEVLSAAARSEEAGSGPTPDLRDAVAGSYTIDRPLGRGGMATVYLARDERHGRLVALKVVHPHIAALDSVSPDGSRFRREIRIAAGLSHPHILPLHDSGVAAGLLYYTMPFVEGESLRDRIAREPLPLPEALRVLRDVARALAHAHRHGIVHRDIKPENILLNREGDALVADFGVAKALEAAATEADAPQRTSPSSVSLQFGTPAYMAPEQAAQAAGTDHRADLYSLGVVAYELLSGAPPFGQRSRHELLKARQDEQPEPLAGLRPDLPPALIALVMGLLSKLPEGRPPDADTVVRNLDQMVAAPGEAVPGTARARSDVARRRAAWIGGTVVLMLAAGFMITRVLGVGPAASMLAAGTLSRSDALLVADFEIRGGADSTLGSVMAELVRTDLRQSNAVTLLPASTIRPALQRMDRPAGTPLVSAIARELAQREGIKAVVEGDLTPLGAGFVVTLRLVSAEGDELASFHQAADPPDLIPTVGRLTRQLRGRIGESLKVIRASPPLRQVTTPSLEALRKYTEGLRVLTYNRDQIRTATLLKEALELDSTFAMAWTLLAAVYREGAGSPELVDSAAERAYRFRDRLPDRERYHAIATWFRGYPWRDRVRAAEALEAGLRLDSTGFANHLGLLYMSRREYARAESLFSFLVASGSGSLATHQNLTNVLYRQGKRQAAESLSVETRRRFPEEARWAAPAFFHYNRGRLDSAQLALERQIAEGLAAPRVWAAYELSHLHWIRGRLAEASRAWSEAAAADRARGVSRDPARDELRAAFVDVWHHRRPERGLQRLEALLANRPFASVPLRIGGVVRSDTYYLEAARIYALAGRPDRARAVLARFAADLRDTVFTRASAPDVHSVLGEIALAEGRPLVALEEFRRADRLPDGPVHNCAICRDADVGRAFDQAGMADSAIVSFERYLETPQLIRLWQDDIYAAMILQRLGELHETKGNRMKTIEYYERFVALWRHADPELQPRVAAARRRIEAMQAGQRR